MLAKATLPPRAVAALDEPRQAQQAPRFPISLERLMLGLTGSGRESGRGGGVGLSQRNSACLLALVAAAMFVAGTLGPTLFEVLEALQNADYVFTTRGSGPQPWVPIPVICRNAQSTLEAIVASLPRSEPIADAVKQSSRVDVFQFEHRSAMKIAKCVDRG